MVLVKLRNLAQIALLLTAGCANPWKNTTLEKGPFPTYTRLLHEYTNPTATALQRTELEKRIPQLERQTLEHLEEIVEEEATNLIGRKIDFPTPTLHPFVYIVEIGKSPEERFLITWQYSGTTLALKYLADHTGRHFLHAFPYSETLTATIDDCINDKKTLDTALARIRELENEVYKKIGITIDDAKKNEETIDANVGVVEGIT